MRERVFYDTLSSPVCRCCRLWFSNALIIFSEIAEDGAAFLTCCDFCNDINTQRGNIWMTTHLD